MVGRVRKEGGTKKQKKKSWVGQVIFLNIKPGGWGMKTEDKDQIHETLEVKDLGTENQDHELVKTKNKNSKSIRVTNREVELLKFLSVMKFSNFEVLWKRFYFELKNGTLSKSDVYADERINALLSLKLINKSEISVYGMKFYTLSNRGFSFLEKVIGEGVAPRPQAAIDLKHFTHDFEVLLLRELLERNSKSFRWISERELLRMDLPFSYRKKFGFENSFIPDAVLETQSDGLTAVEVEIAPKANSRYHEKVLRYVNLIRETQGDSFSIKKVIYYCISDQALNALVRETSYYPGNFVVVKHQSLIKQRMFHA